MYELVLVLPCQRLVCPAADDDFAIKWLPIEQRIEYFLEIMEFKAIYHENVPNHLKLTRKVIYKVKIKEFN